MSALIRAKDRPAPPRRGKTTKRAVGSRNMRAPVKTPWLTEKNKRSIAITAGLGGLVAMVMVIAWCMD